MQPIAHLLGECASSLGRGPCCAHAMLDQVSALAYPLGTVRRLCNGLKNGNNNCDNLEGFRSKRMAQMYIFSLSIYLTAGLPRPLAGPVSLEDWEP